MPVACSATDFTFIGICGVCTYNMQIGDSPKKIYHFALTFTVFPIYHVLIKKSIIYYFNYK